MRGRDRWLLGGALGLLGAGLIGLIVGLGQRGTRASTAYCEPDGEVRECAVAPETVRYVVVDTVFIRDTTPPKPPVTTTPKPPVTRTPPDTTTLPDTTTPAPSGVAFPNEPASWTLLSEYDLAADVPDPGEPGPYFTEPWAAGWSMVQRRSSNGYLSRVSDRTAPRSPPYTLQVNYPRDYRAGGEPGIAWRRIPDAQRVYFGAWLFVKGDWQGHSSGVNKLAFVWLGNKNMVVLGFRGNGELFVATELTSEPFQNTETTTNRTGLLGKWRLIEWTLNKSDRSLRFYVDGKLQGQRTNVTYPANAFTQIEFGSTWGGVGGPSKTQNDWYRFDHVKVRFQ